MKGRDDAMAQLTLLRRARSPLCTAAGKTRPEWGGQQWLHWNGCGNSRQCATEVAKHTLQIIKLSLRSVSPRSLQNRMASHNPGSAKAKEGRINWMKRLLTGRKFPERRCVWPGNELEVSQ